LTQVAAKAIGAIPSLIFYPKVPFLFQSAFLIYWVAALLYFFSAGHVTRNNCKNSCAAYDLTLGHRREIWLANPKLTFAALFSLVLFFYTDRLDVAVADMEDLVRICKYCGCVGLQKVLEKEMVHQKYADYKAIKRVDDSQKRFIFQGLSLPESERMPAALYNLFNLLLKNSGKREISW
jgi:hypothetical protein